MARTAVSWAAARTAGSRSRLGDGDAELVVVRLVAEDAAHAAAAGVEDGELQVGDGAQGRLGGGAGEQRALVAVRVQQRRAARTEAQAAAGGRFGHQVETEA